MAVISNLFYVYLTRSVKLNHCHKQDFSLPAIIQFNRSGQVGIKSGDYCHLSPMPHTGCPSLRTHVVFSRNILSNQKNEIGKATFPFA